MRMLLLLFVSTLAPALASAQVPFNRSRALVAALYAWFLAGNDPNWDVDATVTRPAQIAAAGDTGFALVNLAGDQILIADHALVGGLCIDGGALGAADDLVAAAVPGGCWVARDDGTDGET